MIELLKLNGSKLELRVTTPEGLDLLIEWRTRRFSTPKIIKNKEVSVETRCSTSLGHVGLSHCSVADSFSAHKGRAKSLERALKTDDGVSLLLKADRESLWREILRVFPPPPAHGKKG